MSMPLSTSRFEAAAAELVELTDRLGVGAAELPGLISEPCAVFAATRVLSGAAVSHNPSTVAVLGAATAQLRAALPGT